ncbi:hypothetical protein [Marinoscillum furvescens]|uniref:Uncharacterized protein n=1 Tax=Marinoscillum furvescens DSM 4134 TaxID=1122208 RepID=A0A3D9L9F7_MARFU|nr:hypothetical protein [Marinoscillum furvescens]REE02107.1 hypothetical protein C7460_102129 [Marinoscillum furvescens DSM 4134]
MKQTAKQHAPVQSSIGFFLSKKEVNKIKTNAILSVLVIALGHIIESIDKFI